MDNVRADDTHLRTLRPLGNAMWLKYQPKSQTWKAGLFLSPLWPQESE